MPNLVLRWPYCGTTLVTRGPTWSYLVLIGPTGPDFLFFGKNACGCRRNEENEIVQFWYNFVPNFGQLGQLGQLDVRVFRVVRFVRKYDQKGTNIVRFHYHFFLARRSCPSCPSCPKVRPKWYQLMFVIPNAAADKFTH